MFEVASVYRLAAAAGLFFVAQSANAADLWGPRYDGSIKDAPATYAFSWTGFYVGAHAGLVTGSGEGEIKGEPWSQTEVDLDGAIYGGQIGYNYQMGSAVLGIEGTFSGANIDGNTSCVLNFLNCKGEIDWTATVVGRLGYAMDRAMVYALGGVAWAEVNADVSFLGSSISSKETHVGWVAGLGVEYALSDRVSAKLEYNHMDFGSETHRLDGGIPVSADAEVDTFKLGINVKLTN